MVLSPRVLKIVSVVAVALTLAKLVVGRGVWWRPARRVPQPYALERFEDGDQE